MPTLFARRFASRRALLAPALVALHATACTVDLTNVFDDDDGNGGGTEDGGAPGDGGAGAGVSDGASGAGVSDGGSGAGVSDGGAGGGGPGVCGDGIKASSEECDGVDLGGQSCTTFGFSNGAGLTCVACSFDTSGCMSDCGDGVREPGETCDGDDTGSETCEDYGFVDPAGLGCAADCSQADASDCSASCNGVLEPGEECDGAELDGHDCTEFGFVTAAGLSCMGCELDPSTCDAVCGNGAEEPGEQCDDNNTQPNDGCSPTCQDEAPTGGTCATAIAVALNPGTITLTGSTTGGGSHEGDCTSGGPDRVYAVVPAMSGYLTVRMPRSGTTFDSVLYASTGCSDAQEINDILCVDSYDGVNNQSLNGGEVISFRVQAGNTYYVFADGWTAAANGSYTITMDLSGGRACDDPIPIVLDPGTPMTVLGSNAGNLPNVVGSCGGNPGDEVVYAISRSSVGTVDVATDPAFTNYNSVLYARTTCNSGATEVDCSNNGGTAMESITVPNVGTTPVYVWVDGSAVDMTSASGNFGLTLTP